jgi:hypothetical protein
MAQVMQGCAEGKWTTSKKLYKNLAASGHTVYIQNQDGANPSFITPLLPVAFELSAGKDKPIEVDSVLNMELSVREHNADCIEFGDVVDRFVHGVVTERIKELYPGMAPGYLPMLQRRTLAPKKDFKFAPQPPYAWRFKLTKTTQYLVVIETDENGKDMVRVGTNADIKPGCSVRVNAVLPKLYTSPASFGPNFEADVVLVYAGTAGRQKATAADNFGFGEECSLVVVEAAPTEHKGDSGAQGEGYSQGQAQDQGGAYDDGAADAGTAAEAGGAAADGTGAVGTTDSGGQVSHDGGGDNEDGDGEDGPASAKRTRHDEPH